MIIPQTLHSVIFVVQSLSRVWLFESPWTAARQASLSSTISWSLCKLMSIEALIPSNHLILCRPLLLASVFPSIRIFSNESALHIQSIGASVSVSVLPMNIQGWNPLRSTGHLGLAKKFVWVYPKMECKNTNECFGQPRKCVLYSGLCLLALKLAMWYFSH